MAAAFAFILTACTSEDDILQTGQTKLATSNEVGFDVYTPAATNVTRAGMEGTMTTNRLQRTEAQKGGFGVYAYKVEDAQPTAGDDASASQVTAYNSAAPGKPNFMVNEKLLWNSKNQGWYYNPLKYWPNETDNDSQTTPAEMEKIGTTSESHHLDRLTFFAYAPYVATADKSSPGITYITNKDGQMALTTDGAAEDIEGYVNTTTKEPIIGYQASVDDPNKAVDLLWGVAPAGGLTYTAVNGRAVNVEEGMPLIDMTKPDVNTNMKFLFQHALARIGVTAVAAIDQVGAGGTLDPNTKITIEKITMTGYFGTTGFLNLNNTDRGASVANWIWANGKNISGSTLESEPTAATDLVKTTLTLAANHTTDDNGTIATHLQFVGTPATNPYDPSEAPVAQTNRIGVTTVRQNVIQPAKITATTPWVTYKKYAANALAYSETTPYYNSEACTTKYNATVTATSSAPVYTINSLGAYTEYTSDQTLTYPAVNNFYKLTFMKIVADDVTPSGNQTKLGDVPDGKQMYSFDNIATYTPEPVGTVKTTGKYYIDGDGVGTITKAAALYATAGDYYKRDANYFMVVPTNNFKKIEETLDDEKLRTVRVMIEYYITTEDANIQGGLVQTKNVIEKDVVFPSIANGKSYNLNLILGLTSVKMEAEVDDWKVINVQGDLPQNTAD